MAILGHCSNSRVKVVFAHTLTLCLLVSKGIARTDILERHSMLPATLMNFFVSKIRTFESLWEEYNTWSHWSQQFTVSIDWRCYSNYIWLSATLQPGHFTTLTGWQRQYFAMCILLIRQYEGSQSNICLDWGKQPCIHLAQALGWLACSQPSLQASPWH